MDGSRREMGSREKGGPPRPTGPGQSLQPRSSVSNWSQSPGQAGQAPPLSTSGSMRRSHRHSVRNSRRSALGHSTGEGQTTTLQVVDDDGVDRTPKPLLSVRPSVLKGMGVGGQGAAEEQGSPSSEAGSDFFLDRMSGTAFSKAGAGWYSGTDSGVATPKSDGVIDDDDYEGQRERAKALAAAAAALEQAEQHELSKAEADAQEQAAKAPPPPPPELLTERDLEQGIAISLTETQTDFLLSMPCVTVSLESEEAQVVEAANALYAKLLASKAATDKYTDHDAQTLNPLTKTREVQSYVLTTTSTGCQATTWDIADTYQAHPDSRSAAEGSHAGAGMPTVSQLAGAAAHGAIYRGGGGGGGQQNSHMGSSFMNAGSMRSMAGGSSMMRGSTNLMSWNNPSINTAVPGMMPSLGALKPGALPGSAGEQGGSASGAAAEAAPDPLRDVPQLGEALRLMDMALCHNTYLPKLLQYRDITPIPQRPEPMPLSHEVHEGASRAASQAPSRGISRGPSRQPSDTGSALQNLSHAPSLQPSQAGLLQAAEQQLAQIGGGGPPAGYAPSMAESAWPEELLQDLADLGPDGVPRMEHLWDWKCPQISGHQVVCMSWNKKSPDMLAVGYGTQAFSKAAAAAGMGSGCFGGAPALASQPSQVNKPHADDDDASSTAGSAQAQPVAAPAAVGVQGVVAFWSLKHPEHPLWWFNTRSGVTALDFSRHQPSILAVGLYDGSVAVYDVKSHQGVPAMESDSHTGRHSDPVWQVQWIDRGLERDELLVSISSDGRVTQWSIAKGLEFSDLMSLKRVPRKNSVAPAAAAALTDTTGSNTKTKNGTAPAAGEGDAFISRLTSGMAFDFSSRDQRMYIAGTEDGWIHRCSTSYSEQYLESYEGHMGPVYALRFSPFRTNMWISASADWTLRLWQEGRSTALLSFQSGSHEVNDAQWCPTNSTVFGSVTSGGRLEVWDFGLSTVKPVITHKAGVKLCCLLFSPNSPIVVCGSETGVVSAFRLYNIDREYDTPEEQLSRLEDMIRANVMKTQPGQTAL